MNVTPLEIKRNGTEGLQITWSSGEVHTLDSRLLRQHCPSAVGKAARGDSSHDKPLSPKKSTLQVLSASADEELTLEKIWTIGNYALGMRWADGHDAGIYPYSLLYTLGQQGAQ